MRYFSRLLAPTALALGLCFLATPMLEAAGRGGGGGGGRGGYGGGGRGGYGGGGRGGFDRGGYGRGGYGYGGWGYDGFGLGSGLGYGLGYGYGYGYPGYENYSYPVYGGTTYAPTYYSGYSMPYTYSNPTVVYSDPGVTTQQMGYYSPAPTNQATVEVRVPAEASVSFDGTKTKQTGDDRVFQSPPLEPGRTYTYQIKAEWLKDGQPVVKTQTLQVRAGERSVATFSVN